jgi:tRNA(His) 5'-end guanylyltransferase
MKQDKLGDICKFFEANYSPEVMMPLIPTIIRVDGNNFHNYCKGLVRPFDEGLTDLMIETTEFLVKETGALIGYHQSDEITLVLYSDSLKSPIYHNGEKQKILSKLTGKLVTFFNDKRYDYLPEHEKVANFDCRIYQVPTMEWACKQLLWREKDATKNSVSMLAQSLFSHKRLQGLNGSQMQDLMMEEKGVNWSDLHPKFKRGSYIRKTRIKKPLSIEELEALPKKHNAHKNPNMEIERNVITRIDMPKFSSIENPVEVVFYGAEPIVKN